MANITQIDEMMESDIIDALSDIPSSPIPVTTNPVAPKVENTTNSSATSVSTSTNFNISNIGEFAQLMEQLVAGKTLEISIKVRD